MTKGWSIEIINLNNCIDYCCNDFPRTCKKCKCILMPNYFTCPIATAGLIIGDYILIKWCFTSNALEFLNHFILGLSCNKTNCSVFVEILSGEHVYVLFLSYLHVHSMPHWASDFSCCYFNLLGSLKLNFSHMWYTNSVIYFI